MPKIDHENIGNVAKSKYFKGIIVSTDGSDDTAVVTVPGFGDVSAIIFYHCTKDAVERENGALEDGSSAFKKDDEVIVLKQADGKYKVIGHADGEKRECGIFWNVRLLAGATVLDMNNPAHIRLMFDFLVTSGPSFDVVVNRSPMFFKFFIDDPDFIDDQIRWQFDLFLEANWGKPIAGEFIPPGEPPGPLRSTEYVRIENFETVEDANIINEDEVEKVNELVKYNDETFVFSFAHGTQYSLTAPDGAFRMNIRITFVIKLISTQEIAGVLTFRGYVNNSNFLLLNDPVGPGPEVYDFQIGQFQEL